MEHPQKTKGNQKIKKVFVVVQKLQVDVNWNWEPQAGGIPFLRGRLAERKQNTGKRINSSSRNSENLEKERCFEPKKTGAGNKRNIWGISFSFLIKRTSGVWDI